MIVLSKLAPQYRITMDECYHYERPEVKKQDRRWYERIQCRDGGFIAIYSETPPILLLWTPQLKSARVIAKKIPAVPDLETEWLDGEAGDLFLPGVPGGGGENGRGLEEEAGQKVICHGEIQTD